MKTRYLVSTKKPGLEFKIIERKINPDQTATLTLVGAHGVPFERVVSDSIMEKYGYTLETRVEPDPQ